MQPAVLLIVFTISALAQGAEAVTTPATCEGAVIESINDGKLNLATPEPGKACRDFKRFELTTAAQDQYRKLGIAKSDLVRLTVGAAVAVQEDNQKVRVGPVSEIVLVRTTCEGAVAENIRGDKTITLTPSCKGITRFTLSAEADRAYAASGIVRNDKVRLTVQMDPKADVRDLALIETELRLDAVVESTKPETGVITLSHLAPEGAEKSSKAENDPKLALIRKDDQTQFTVADPAARERLGDYIKDDRVKVRVRYKSGDAAPVTLDRIRLSRRDDHPRNRLVRLALLVIPISVLALLVSLITNWNNVRTFFIGADFQTSNSKTQASVWLFLILAAFFATLGERLIYGERLFGYIAMPPNLAMLAGISGITFVAAKVIRKSQEPAQIASLTKEVAELDVKAKAEAAAAQVNATKKREEIKALGTPPDAVKLAALTKEAEALEAKAKLENTESGILAKKKRDEIEALRKAATAPPAGDTAPGSPATGEATLSQLTTNERNQFSLGDTQLMMVTLVAIVVFILQLWNFLGTMELRASIEMPDIDGSITTLFGISHATYLANKSASNPVK